MHAAKTLVGEGESIGKTRPFEKGGEKTKNRKGSGY